jgi:hypothetical protein
MSIWDFIIAALGIVIPLILLVITVRDWISNKQIANIWIVLIYGLVISWWLVSFYILYPDPNQNITCGAGLVVCLIARIFQQRINKTKTFTHEWGEKDTTFQNNYDREQVKHLFFVAIAVIFILVMLIIVFIFGIFILPSLNSGPIIQPSPTIQVRSTITPTIKPTKKVIPTNTSIVSNCHLWSTITLADVGNNICVYGSIYNIAWDQMAYYISFSNKPNSFYILSYDYYFPDVEKNSCIMTTGKIQRLDNSPVLVIKNNTEIYKIKNCSFCDCEP